MQRVDLHRAQGEVIGAAQFDLREQRVAVGDRWVPPVIVVNLPGGAAQPSLEMTIEVRQGIPVCAELRLSARADGPEVRDKDLRAVRIESLIEQAVARCSMRQVDPSEIPRMSPADLADGIPAENYEAARRVRKENLANVRRARAGRPRVSRERLAKVAELYRAHIDSQPVEAVRAAFGVSYRTAARYVELCRSDEYRLLPKTSPGRKKA